MSSIATLPYESWYPLDAAKHVQPGSVSLSLLFGQELAVWRSSSRQVHVWENRCPHRSVRLTLGLIVEDQLACRYHGWRYGAEGQCTGIPANPGVTPPKAACVKTYASLERDGLIWATLRPAPITECPTLEPGLTFCRSYVVPRPAQGLMAAAVADGFAQHHRQVLHAPLLGDAGPASLVVQPISANRTGLHLMLAADGDHASGRSLQLAANAALKAAIARWQRVPARTSAEEARHA